MNARSRPVLREQRGFGLIEVLVSVVVIAVGLLGIAKMHALAIGNTRVSASRSLAAIYVGSLSSAMHANAGYWQVPGTTINVSTSPNADASAIVLSDATLNGKTVDCTYSATNTAPPVCTSAEMAADDLRTWGMSLLQLPGGTGTVVCTSATPVTCRITVSWAADKIIGVNAATTNTATATPQTFSALIQP